MTTKIRYVYDSFLLNCECCSDSQSYLEIWEVDKSYQEVPCYELLSNEEELKDYMKRWHPEVLEYEIEEDCEWF